MLDLIIKNGQCYINGVLKNIDVSVKDGKIQSIGKITEEATGDGMIHAAFTAVKKILKSDATLIDYRVESITKGSDATAEIVTIINDGHLMKQGRSVSTDVVQGSVESFLNALNK